MKYSKIFQYAYLVFAIIFIYEVISTYINKGVINYSFILLAALAVFMYFFRQKFRRKYENKDNSN